jgi:acyl-CoA thioesterase
MRWAEGQHPYSGAVEGDARIYVRFNEQGVHDLVDLVCLADAIPPSAIAMFSTPAPISSMNWTLELVRPLTPADAEGWWRFDATLTAASSGYAWENVEIWSPRGELTALSRQCIAVFA